MKLPLLKKFSTLFTTKSGIEVKVATPVLPKQNLLVKNNRTGQVKLNGETISDAAYRRLLKAIELHHPDACIYADAYQIFFSYPKMVQDC